MKKRNTTSPAPSLSPEELQQLETHLSKIGATMSRLRVTAAALSHEEAYSVDCPEAVYQSPLFLQSCSEVLTDVTKEVWDLHGKCLALLPEYKTPTPAKS